MIALLLGANGDKRQTPLNGIVSRKGCRDDKPNLIGGATSTMGLCMLWTLPGLVEWNMKIFQCPFRLEDVFYQNEWETLHPFRYL